MEQIRHIKIRSIMALFECEQSYITPRENGFLFSSSHVFIKRYLISKGRV